MLVVGLISTREKEVFLYALISVDSTILGHVMALNFQELVFNLQILVGLWLYNPTAL